MVSWRVEHLELNPAAGFHVKTMTPLDEHQTWQVGLKVVECDRQCWVAFSAQAIGDGIIPVILDICALTSLG